MITSARDLLEAFEHLPKIEQRDLAIEILRRTSDLDWPALSDEDLTHSAEDLFLELDAREASDAGS